MVQHSAARQFSAVQPNGSAQCCQIVQRSAAKWFSSTLTSPAIPYGNLVRSGCSLPSGARVLVSQPSSVLIQLYLNTTRSFPQCCISVLIKFGERIMSEKYQDTGAQVLKWLGADPASRRPLVTKNFATLSRSCAVTVEPNAVQLFMPMIGVLHSPVYTQRSTTETAAK